MKPKETRSIVKLKDATVIVEDCCYEMDVLDL